MTSSPFPYISSNMAIGQVVTSVIKDVLGNDSIKENDISFNNEDERLAVDRSDFKPWYNDKFNSSCTKIAQRFAKTSERFEKYTSADILACIKFESANHETSVVRTGSKYSRRLQFSTGASISLDNLIKCTSDHQIDSRSAESKYGTECTVFPDTELISVSPNKSLPGSENVVPVVDNTRSRASGFPWQENICQYDSPFDQRLTFSGLAKLVLGDKPATQEAEVENSGPETFNCLIESDCPTEFTNNYLAAFRGFVRNLLADTKCKSTSETALNLDCNTNRHKTTDHVPAFVGEVKENLELWDRVLSTKVFWSDESSRSSLANESVSESLSHENTDIGGTHSHSSCSWPNTGYTANKVPRIPDGNSPDVTRNEADRFQQEDACNRSSVSETGISSNCTNWNTEVDGDLPKTHRNSSDETLTTLNDIADYVTHSSTNLCFTEGDVKTRFQSTTSKSSDRQTNWARGQQNQPYRTRQKTTSEETNERTCEPVKQTETSQMLDLRTASSDKIYKQATQESVLGTPKPQTRPVIHVEPNLRCTTDRVQTTQFPQSSVFWSSNSSPAQVHHHRQSQLPNQASIHNHNFKPVPAMNRQDQQCQRPTSQQHQHIQHQQPHQHVPILVPNQYGLYVNQSQQQTHTLFRQLATPSSLQNHQNISTANTQRAPVQYSNVSQQPTLNGASTQNNHHRQRPVTMDDEVWYINGVPHYHARPVNQQAPTNQRFSGRQETNAIVQNSNPHRPWSVNGCNSDVRVFIPPNMINIPPAPTPQQQTVFQQFQPSWHAQRNINTHNACPPQTLVRNDCVIPYQPIGDRQYLHPRGWNNNSNNNNKYDDCSSDNNSNNTSNNQSEDSSSDICSDGSHRSSPAESPSLESVHMEDIMVATNPVTHIKTEKHITVLATHARCDDEKKIKKRKQRQTRSGLVRIV